MSSMRTIFESSNRIHSRFFEIADFNDIPPPEVEENFLDIFGTDDAHDRIAQGASVEPGIIRLLHNLERSHDITSGANEPSVDTFSMELLHATQFTDEVQRIYLDVKPNHRLWVCGMKMYAKPDLCIKDANQLVVHVQENKAYLNGADPEPQLIAEAISVFWNNNLRLIDLHMDPLDHDIIPGIIMVGTMPKFYKIPVSIELVDAVRDGTFPELETVVRSFTPPIPPVLQYTEGMQPLDNREAILSYYAAYRHFVLHMD